MEQFDSSEEESSRVLEQQQRNDKQQCPSCAAELTEASETEQVEGTHMCSKNNTERINHDMMKVKEDRRV